MTDLLRQAISCGSSPTWRSGPGALAGELVGVVLRRGVLCLCLWSALLSTVVRAQSVCLPAPRLLTTMPMGGQAGTQVEITITGDYLDEAGDMSFSGLLAAAGTGDQPGPTPTATQVRDAAGQVVPNRYRVDIPADCRPGLYEARVMTRLGISAARVFSVGTLPEVVQTAGNTQLSAAMPLPMNSVCNAVMTARSVDHYVFEARQGQRCIVHVASRGIDSKLDAVLIVADANGRDLAVERLGGALDFTAPADGRYVIKVHELTYRGGPAFFYRLSLQELPAEAPLPQFAATSAVSSFSWPPAGLPVTAAAAEAEPNDAAEHVQQITLPCDLSGSFFPAADVDTFEFMAKKGDVWWVEVASERLGRPTDPAILVQHVSQDGNPPVLTDVAELTDIPSPMKPSSNGYAYDGPPYDGGSADIIGRLEIRQDGLHRLQLTDLFGGTRSDPRNVYRLIIRQAAPDFAVAAWGLHMELRNGDRNALSKPLALRAGATMALEVVAVRRDGFDGEIELVMEGLPAGVTAQGLKIPAGGTRGIMLLTADQDAPPGLSTASFSGRAVINGQPVTRPCRMAAMAWPVADAWSEIPSPRLIADVPVSVTNAEFAPVSIAPAERKIWEVTAGQKLTIPLVHVRRSEFSGAVLQLKTFGTGFERAPQFDVSLATDASTATLDLAALKTPPGEYQIAFYGGAVAKYRYRPELVAEAEARHKQAEAEVARLAAELQQLQSAAAAPADSAGPAEQPANEPAVTDQAAADKAAADKAAAERVQALAELTKQHQAAMAEVSAAAMQLKAATERAVPRDTVDIVVSEPIAIRVQPAEAP